MTIVGDILHQGQQTSSVRKAVRIDICAGIDLQNAHLYYLPPYSSYDIIILYKKVVSTRQTYR